MKIKVTKLNSGAIIPTRGSNGAAGLDLYACTTGTTVIMPHETVKIPTGLAIELPHGYFGAIFARSGLATKRGLAPANKVGVIDADYRGEIMVSLHNHSDEAVVVEGGERVAQLCIVPFLKADFVVADGLSDTVRGAGGFGSTGKK